MNNFPEYEFHPIANLFPLMTDEELDALAEDIKVNGLTFAIMLYEGKILDSRNRFLACQRAGVEPGYEEYEGDTPIEFVLSLNLHRKHLTTSQRAAIAAELATLPQGARTDLASNEARFSQSQAGVAMGVSRSSVQRAAAVRAADSELHEKVKAGEVSVEDAGRMASVESRDSTREFNNKSNTTAASKSNGDYNEEATPFCDEKARPITDAEKCVREFKKLVKGSQPRVKYDSRAGKGIHTRSFRRSPLNVLLSGSHQMPHNSPLSGQRFRKSPYGYRVYNVFGTITANQCHYPPCPM